MAGKNVCLPGHETVQPEREFPVDEVWGPDSGSEEAGSPPGCAPVRAGVEEPLFSPFCFVKRSGYHSTMRILVPWSLNSNLAR